MAGARGRHWIRWNKGMKQGFLDHLAATGNVKAAAAEIGIDPRAFYNLRRRDAGFAAQWGEAITLGYQMIETRLIGHALAGCSTGDPIRDDGMAPLDPLLAMSMLAAHRAAVAGVPYKGGPRLKRATEEETNAALMKKLDAVEKRLRKAEA